VIDPIEQRHLVWRLTLLPAIAAIAVVAAIMIAMGGRPVALPGIPDKGSSGIPDDYDELQFTTVHRPLVTYFVDRRYGLCFATRKPDYQDLVQLSCTPNLLSATGSVATDNPPSATKHQLGFDAATSKP
jgi:hypothetical protein